jgi:hypothetical protein
LRTEIKGLCWEEPLDLARSGFYVVRETSVKFGSNTQNGGIKKYA